MKISTKKEVKLVLDGNEVAALAKLFVLISHTPKKDPSFRHIANGLTEKQKKFLTELGDSMRDVSMST